MSVSEVKVETKGLTNTTKKNHDNVSLSEQAVIESKLEILNELDLTGKDVELYVVENITNKKSTSRFKTIKQLKLDATAQDEFRSFCSYYISNYTHVVRFTNMYTAQDNRFYHVPLASTDFGQILDYINQNDIEAITLIEELSTFNAYVVKIVIDEEDTSRNLWAFHYFAKNWDTKKSKTRTLVQRITDRNLVATVVEKNQFEITRNFDFFSYTDDIFIADVRKFETAMNYQERLLEKTDEAIRNLCSSHAMDSSSQESFKNIIGKDKHLMRQLSIVEEKGYYKNTQWFESLIEKVRSQEAADWLIEIDSGGKIVMKDDKNYIKEVLTLLQNKRVKTLVDNKIMDVDGDLIPVGNA